MDFHFFRNSYIGQNQDDKITNRVLKILVDDESLPKTNDIKTLAQHVYLKFDEQETTAFQKLILIWRTIANDFKQDFDPNLLEEVNYIIGLQDNVKK